MTEKRKLQKRDPSKDKTVWIHSVDLQLCIQVPEENLERWLSEGWKKGKKNR